MFGTLLDSASYVSSLADFNPYSFAVIKHNCEYNIDSFLAFSEF